MIRACVARITLIGELSFPNSSNSTLRMQIQKLGSPSIPWIVDVARMYKPARSRASKFSRNCSQHQLRFTNDIARLRRSVCRATDADINRRKGCWSNGTTPGLQPGNRGSTPRRSTDNWAHGPTRRHQTGSLTLSSWKCSGFDSRWVD